MTTKYSDVLADWLVELGYSHCFFVAGGNIMHLLESCSRRMTCVPVIHEVAAGIAAEYFNEVGLGTKAFALVTAGPGLTNIVTAIAGAYLESRELLVIGGQVKVPDLARDEVRQRGIQEIDGVAIARPITEKSVLVESVVDRKTFAELVQARRTLRNGPVFLEIPLDVQGTQVDAAALSTAAPAVTATAAPVPDGMIATVVARLSFAKRPVILVGAGVSRATMTRHRAALDALGIPVMLTWNAADRMDADDAMYFGRPNTWGQRYANVLMQSADVLLALGTRLGLQQTGFNWQSFVPGGEVIQVDCDPAELKKGHPRVAMPVLGDANAVLDAIVAAERETRADHEEWLGFCRMVKAELPLVEAANHTGEGYLSPFVFARELSKLATADDIVIPCSSGGAFTVMMQTFAPRHGQRIVTNKGLASMGYGLSGAIGAALAGKGRRTILVEGDGGFTQNLQEIGTVVANALDLKIFLFDDNGYASIRMTQKNYFGGRYVGCDRATGLGIPSWEKLFAVYDIPVVRLRPGFENDAEFRARFDAPGPAAFLVTIDPTQTYFPKISSRVTATGSMESNPLHLMSPDLDDATAARVLRHLPVGGTR